MLVRAEELSTYYATKTKAAIVRAWCVGIVLCELSRFLFECFLCVSKMMKVEQSDL